MYIGRYVDTYNLQSCLHLNLLYFRLKKHVTLFSSPFLNQAYEGEGLPSASHSSFTVLPGSSETSLGVLVNVGASNFSNIKNNTNMYSIYLI